MSRGRRTGFSLIELLVVIAVLAVLSGIVLPAIGRTRATAREVCCANNLRRIGEAFVCKKSDEAVRSEDPIQAYRWVEDLLPYAAGTERMFLCPDDEEPAHAALARTRVACYRGSKRWLFDFELRARPGRVQRHDLNDHAYELWFEDGVDSDFNDIKLRVEHLEGGKARISTISRSAAYHFDLIELPERKVLMSRIGEGKGWNQSCTVSGPLVSYGVNAFAERIHPATNCIVALDYELTTADCGGVDAVDYWSEWRRDDGAYTFARHRDAANVLFADGHVERMHPNDINPAYLAPDRSIWCP